MCDKREKLQLPFNPQSLSSQLKIKIIQPEGKDVLGADGLTFPEDFPQAEVTGWRNLAVALIESRSLSPGAPIEWGEMIIGQVGDDGEPVLKNYCGGEIDWSKSIEVV